MISTLQRRRVGFTMVEIIVAVAVMTVVFIGVATLFNVGRNAAIYGGRLDDLSVAARLAAYLDDDLANVDSLSSSEVFTTSPMSVRWLIVGESGPDESEPVEWKLVPVGDGSAHEIRRNDRAIAGARVESWNPAVIDEGDIIAFSLTITLQPPAVGRDDGTPRTEPIVVSAFRGVTGFHF